MLVSHSTNDYSMSLTTASATVQTPRVRIRTLNVCEPSYPSRDIVRQENFARRKNQELQGWGCPRTIPYQGIEPVNLPPETPKTTDHERTTLITPAKTMSRISSAGSGSTGPKSGSVGQDDNLMKAQFEATIKRLQTAQQKQIKKSSDILKSIQLGHSIKDIVAKYPRRNSGRVESVDIRGISSASSDNKDSDVLYDMLVDDFDEDDDADASSVSDIRDDIMSPRTVTNTNITGTGTIETSEIHKHHPPEISLIPMKLCQSAPPLNRNNIRQATLRPFTPRYSSLSARLRLTRHMPFRDALYRQLCVILWLLRAMARPDWSEMISGCWNIEQWLRSESRSHAQQYHHHHHLHHHHHHHQIKKLHEPIKIHPTKSLPTESKTLSKVNPPKETVLTSLRTSAAPTDVPKRKASVLETSASRIVETTSSDDQTGRRSNMSDASERFDLQFTSANIDSDLNESSSSKSNQGDATESTNLDISQTTANIRSVAAASALPTTNTSRTSLSSMHGQSTARAKSARLSSILERRRSPDMLLKKWIKNQKINFTNPDKTRPLTDTQIRLLRVGDSDDLMHIFGLQNETDLNREQIRERQTRNVEQKLVTNVKRRPATTTATGSTQSKRHAQILHKIKRDFNDFTEEQSIILNNRLEQVDNDRLFYCQTKLRELQDKMPPLTILDRLLKQLRFDENKKKINAAYLKYQSWYVDLLQMIQPDYNDDHIIVLLLKEMEEFADPGDKPTAIRFKIVLTELRPHEICHPDIMAAIEFMRIHVVKMGNEEFDKFFCKQFPTVTRYIKTIEDTDENDDDETKQDNQIID